MIPGAISATLGRELAVYEPAANNGRLVIGGWRDDSTDPDRSRPYSCARGRLPGAGQPAAHSGADPAASGRVHRGRADQRHQPGEATRPGVRATGVVVG